MIVLIIEESEVNARAYAQAMRKHTAHTCSDPTAALELIKRLRPDILVINLSAMIDLSALPYRPKVIIALSYFVTDHIAEWANEMGVQEILLLPCSLKYLASRIDFFMQEACTRTEYNMS